MTRKTKQKTDYKKLLTPVNGVIALLLLAILFLVTNKEDIQQSASESSSQTTTIPTLPYSCYPVCITESTWAAKDTGYDIGTIAQDGARETKVGDFGYLIAGQNIPLGAGTYSIIFEMRIDNNKDNTTAVFIEASRNKGLTVIGKEVLANEFLKPNTLQNFTLIWQTHTDTEDVEFRVHFNKKQYVVGINKVYLVPV